MYAAIKSKNISGKNQPVVERKQKILAGYQDPILPLKGDEMSAIRILIDIVLYQSKECLLCRDLSEPALQELDLIEQGLITVRNVLPNERGGVQFQIREIVDPLLMMIRSKVADRELDVRTWEE